MDTNKTNKYEETTSVDEDVSIMTSIDDEATS